MLSDWNIPTLFKFYILSVLILVLMEYALWHVTFVEIYEDRYQS